MTDTSRPTLGERIAASDRLVRVTEYAKPDNGGWSNVLKKWVRCGDRPVLKPKPIEGIYVGFRTYADGRREYLGAEYGIAFHPSSYREVWLIVPSERQAPVPVLPEDARKCSREGSDRG